MVAGISRAYSVSNPQLLPIEGTEDVMVISKFGEVDPTHFIDTSVPCVREVNHLTGTASADSSPASMDSNLEGPRVALQEALKAYVASYYVSDKAAAVYARDGKLSFVLVGSRHNLRNYWAGAWTSTWTVDGGVLTGTIKVRAHYFEDGNVQLQVAKDVDAATVGGGDGMAVTVVEAVTAAEQAMQQGLEEAYSNMSQEILKAIRRVMPISGTKMTWNLAAHKMTAQLRK